MQILIVNPRERRLYLAQSRGYYRSEEVSCTTVTKMHGLETQRKHNTAHYLCWGSFMQKYGSYLVTCVLYLLRINQW